MSEQWENTAIGESFVVPYGKRRKAQLVRRAMQEAANSGRYFLVDLDETEPQLRVTRVPAPDMSGQPWRDLQPAEFFHIPKAEADRQLVRLMMAAQSRDGREYYLETIGRNWRIYRLR